MFPTLSLLRIPRKPPVVDGEYFPPGNGHLYTEDRSANGALDMASPSIEHAPAHALIREISTERTDEPHAKQFNGFVGPALSVATVCSWILSKIMEKNSDHLQDDIAELNPRYVLFWADLTFLDGYLRCPLMTMRSRHR
jgi:hypothetical protein